MSVLQEKKRATASFATPWQTTTVNQFQLFESTTPTMLLYKVFKRNVTVSNQGKGFTRTLKQIQVPSIMCVAHAGSNKILSYRLP